MLKYLAELSGLSSAHYDYALMKRLLLQGEIMQEKCEVLKTRCFFNLPSNVEHVNRVYSFFQRCFDIPGYRASLNAGVKGSVNVCQKLCDPHQGDRKPRKICKDNEERNVYCTYYGKHYMPDVFQFVLYYADESFSRKIRRNRRQRDHCHRNVFDNHYHGGL